MLFILLGVAGGIAIAFILNKILADRIGNKDDRVGLKIVSYVICIVLSTAFAAIGSLQTILDTFLEDRIEFIEVKLAKVFPDSNILETNIDINELAAAVGRLQRVIKDTNTNNDSYFEKLVYTVFLDKLSAYATKDSINAIAAMKNKNGSVTIKSILYNLKKMALETVSPYFVFGQIGIVILLFVYIGIYSIITVFFKRSSYNKSIVFGDINCE